MVNQQEDDIKKKWAIHRAQVEQDHVIKCLDSILLTIKESLLEKGTKHVLAKFYLELKEYYASQSNDELINNAKVLQEYSATYLENHNMLLLVGVLTQEKIDSYEIAKAVQILQKAPSQLRDQGTKLINTLKEVEPYAVPRKQKLDEDFYNEDHQLRP